MFTESVKGVSRFSVYLSALDLSRTSNATDLSTGILGGTEWGVYFTRTNVFLRLSLCIHEAELPVLVIFPSVMFHGFTLIFSPRKVVICDGTSPITIEKKSFIALNPLH